MVSRRYRRSVGKEPEPRAVFVFYEDGSGVDAYASLRELQEDLEAIDVRNGEYAFYSARGRVVEAVVEGSGAQDFELRLTDVDASQELQRRLASALPTAGIDASLAQSPLAAAQALINAEWDVRWPRRPAWLDRRLHGEKPVVDG